MPEYNVRCLKPRQYGWVRITAASPEEAVSEYHYNQEPEGFVVKMEDHGGPLERLHLIRAEVEGHGYFVSRIFKTGIFRRGGIKLPGKSLESIAAALEWERPVEELIAEGWLLEERYHHV